MARARSAHIPVSVACSFTKSALSRAIAAAPERPLASTITASLVDMSPSTVMVLKVSSTASVSAACSTAGATVASVAMKHNIVAICGWIIPEPLAMAANFTARPPTLISRKATLVVRSVVRIASAAVMISSPRAATSAGTAAAIRSTGMRMPMAPVDAVSTVSASTPSPAATAAATARSSTAPSGPVIALALPLFATIARMPIAGSRPAP